MRRGRAEGAETACSSNPSRGPCMMTNLCRLCGFVEIEGGGRAYAIAREGVERARQGQRDTGRSGGRGGERERLSDKGVDGAAFVVGG
jgi:hypothetical protein